MPTLNALNATALRSRQFHDYLATYDIPTGKITKLTLRGFAEPRGLNLHGMDVVPDEKDSNVLWIYLVNHRPPVDASVYAERIGANSVVEVFKTRLGADHVEWVQTVEDAKVMITPNDIVGGANGQEFWFTNDNSVKIGIVGSCILTLSNLLIFVGVDAANRRDVHAKINICWLLPPQERLQDRLIISSCQQRDCASKLLSLAPEVLFIAICLRLPMD